MLRPYEVIVAQTVHITVPVLAHDANDAGEQALATGLGPHFPRTYGEADVEDIKEIPVCNPNE